MQNRLAAGYPGYLITAVGCFTLGLLIAFQRPADPVARLGALFIMTASIAFGLPSGWAVPWRQLPFAIQLLLWIPQISRFVMEGITLSLFVIFPRRLFHSRWPWAVVWAPVLATLPWRIAGLNSMIHRSETALRTPAWLNQAIFVRTIMYLAAGIVVLVLSYRLLVDPNERRRVRVVVAGTAMAFSAAICLVWYFSFIGKDLGVANLLEYLAFMGTLTCPLAFYYAIIRHRVFDIQVIIRQSLQYALARGAILGLVPFLAAALALDLALNSQQPLIEIMRDRGWIYAALGGLVLLIYSQRKQWLDALDRRFFRERYDANRVLRDVAKEIRVAKTFEQVSPLVVVRIETALHCESVSVLMRRPLDLEFHPLASAPAGQTPPAVRADSKLIGLARVLGRPLEVLLGDSAWLERQLPYAEIQFVHERRIDLLVPIALEPRRTEALLLLGIKRSEEPYTREDQELLDAIASSLALLLEQPAPAREFAGAATFEECPDCGTCYEKNSLTCTVEGATLVPVGLPRILSGRYRLERRRGRGGMGAVYEATDIALERRVAVKVIRDDLVNTAEAAARFRRESRAAAGFAHPNVVTVHDYGVESGTRAFLVMELLTGATLREEMTLCKRLSPDRTLEIFRSVCAAVEAAHTKRLIHRDLKPENIFLARTADGKGEIVKVLDFGVAKFLTAPGDALTHVTAETAAGMVVGTPAYMSPEQLLGEEPTEFWDLWALAVVAYEMLAGALPCALATSDWRRDVIAGTFTPVQKHLIDAPVVLQVFFEECFTPDRTKRPASVADFRAKLESVL